MLILWAPCRGKYWAVVSLSWRSFRGDRLRPVRARGMPGKRCASERRISGFVLVVLVVAIARMPLPRVVHLYMGVRHCKRWWYTPSRGVVAHTCLCLCQTCWKMGPWSAAKQRAATLFGRLPRRYRRCPVAQCMGDPKGWHDAFSSRLKPLGWAGSQNHEPQAARTFL